MFYNSKCRRAARQTRGCTVTGRNAPNDILTDVQLNPAPDQSVMWRNVSRTCANGYWWAPQLCSRPKHRNPFLSTRSKRSCECAPVSKTNRAMPARSASAPHCVLGPFSFSRVLPCCWRRPSRRLWPSQTPRRTLTSVSTVK